MPKHPAPLPLLPRKPLVSIITSNLNHGVYLEDTILSVLEQDYEPIELIIVDGASKDNSLDILHKYGRDRRVRWISEPDQGHLQALNKGLKLATGDIIGFQHSSDTYQPGTIKEAVQEFASDPFLALVGGSVQITDVRGLTTGQKWQLPMEKCNLSLDEILGFVNYPGVQATFLRRDLALAIGGFNEELSTCHTIFFIHFMLEAWKIGMHSRRIPNLWGNYRIHLDHVNIHSSATGLPYARERKLIGKRMVMQYRHYFTSRQVRLARRSGYEYELCYRIGVLRQVFRAIPTFVTYLWLGGPFLPSLFWLGYRLPPSFRKFCKKWWIHLAKWHKDVSIDTSREMAKEIGVSTRWYRSSG